MTDCLEMMLLADTSSQNVYTPAVDINCRKRYFVYGIVYVKCKSTVYVGKMEREQRERMIEQSWREPSRLIFTLGKENTYRVIYHLWFFRSCMVLKHFMKDHELVHSYFPWTAQRLNTTFH